MEAGNLLHYNLLPQTLHLLWILNVLWSFLGCCEDGSGGGDLSYSSARNPGAHAHYQPLLFPAFSP